MAERAVPASGKRQQDGDDNVRVLLRCRCAPRNRRMFAAVGAQQASRGAAAGHIVPLLAIAWPACPGPPLATPALPVCPHYLRAKCAPQARERPRGRLARASSGGL